jgi:glutamate racemase
MGKVNLVDSSSAVAKEVSGVLEKKDMAACRSKRRGRIKCFVSDDVEGFRRNAGIFLKSKIEVKKAVL